MGSGSTLDYCDRTDIGRRRSNNQDSKAVLEPWSREHYRKRGWLFVVADGMGAHAAGEMASAIAAEHVPLVYEKHASRSPALALRTSIEQANAEIHSKGESSVDLKGMGTTCTALVIVPRGAVVGHVGDSRAYRIRGSRIDQLSRDHSLVWELRDMHAAGEIESDLPIREAPKNIITRSMGPHRQVNVDLEGPFPVEAGDVFVLCSDGLSGQVADEEIGLLAGTLPPREAAAALVGLSLVRGAPDNVTVIVARAGEKEVSKSSPADEPWSLTEEPDATSPKPVPWRMLGVAAASLFGFLVALGSLPPGFFAGQAENSGTLAVAATLALAALALLAFLSSLLFAFLGFLPSAAAEVRLLPAGAKLGGGPYRSYDCGPGEKLLEGIVASVEAAAEGLDSATRAKAADCLRRTRQRVSDKDYHGAVSEAAAAIAVYARAVEAARADVTAHDGRNRG